MALVHRDLPHQFEQEGDERPSNAPHDGRQLQDRMVHDASHPRGHAREQAWPTGGEGKFVEADETFTGGKAKNRAYKAPPPKEPALALVERGGKVRSFHVPEVTATTLKPIIVDAISKDSHFRTDESGVYWQVGEQFASHRTVTHSINEYVRGDAHTNTVEGYFSIFKRGIYGVYHHVSHEHLKEAYPVVPGSPI